MLISSEALTRFGVRSTPMDQFDQKVTTSGYCNLQVPDEGQPPARVMHMRSWMERGGWAVHNFTHGYTRITAAHAVAATRRNAQQCSTYSGSNDVAYHTLDVINPGKLTGVDDSYGHCTKVVPPAELNDPIEFLCTLHLGRGNLLSSIAVASQSLDRSKKTLLEITPIAASALASA